MQPKPLPEFPGRHSARYLPATFEERGAALPFTTPLFAHARVRCNERGQLEACIPRFADLTGQYIVAWKGLRDLTTMTLHDRMLYEQIQERGARTPEAIRLAALDVARSGVAGPEVAEAAAKALAEEDEARALSHVVLILRVLQESAKIPVADLVRDITTPSGQERVRQALFAMADRLSVPADLLDKRLSDLADLIHPVGVPWNPMTGRLRRIFRRLAKFRTSLAAWGRDRLVSAAEDALFCAEVAELTLDIVGKLLGDLDQHLRSPYAVVMEWHRVRPRIEALMGRLSWLLDGWGPITEWWLGSEGSGEQEQAAIIAQMLPVLPLIPRAELEPAQHDSALHMLDKRRWLRLNQDWLTGDFDLDAIQRLEQLKARAM